MRVVGGKWLCTWCGATLEDVPVDKPLHIELRSSAGQPSYRVVERDGVEVHRCESPPKRTY